MDNLPTRDTTFETFGEEGRKQIKREGKRGEVE